jgi:4-amino-4-deoxy-L-arabinose transferase-like glycosyltransferase
VTPPRREPGVDRAVWIAAAFTLARVPLAAMLELSPDEAYYWLWSKRLAWSYFDHPPMVAWLIAASTRVLGDGALAVRLPALLCSFVTVVALAAVARRVATPGRAARGAEFTALLASVMPLMHAGAIVITPDAPAAAFWAISMWGMARVLDGETAGFYIAGAALGAAMLSKYTTVVFGASMAGLVIFDPTLRAWLRRPAPWAGAVLGALIFSPVLVWNARHGWASFSFQIHHGTGGHGGLQAGLEFFGAQIAIVTPMLAALLLLHVFSSGVSRTESANRFLTASIAPMFVLFTLLSFKSRGEANWAAFAYLGAAVVGGLSAANAGADRELAATNGATPGKRTSWMAGLYASTVILGALASVIVSVHAVHPLVALPADRLQVEFHGWRDRVRAARAAAGPTGVLLGDSYRVAAELAYYGGRVEGVGVARLPVERLSMFDVWTDPVLAEGADAVYVSWHDRDVPADWIRAFRSVDRLPLPAGVTGMLARLVALDGPPPTRPGTVGIEGAP